MRKLLILLVAICLSPCLARAQLGNVVLIHFSGTPTGGCSQNQLAENDTTGAVYNCASGSWAAITGSASSVAFSGVTTGTNASVLHIGAGGSLDTAGGGTIAATSLEAKTWEAPGTIGSTTPNTGAFSTLSATGHVTLEGVTSTGATGTGNLAFSASPTFTGTANFSGITLTGLLTTAASVAGGAGFNLPPGIAPTSPNNGDLWTTTNGLFAEINGATVGPFGTGAGSITLQTNGSANGSNSALNFVTSATNSTGLSATPSNINTNQEKIEVGGTLNLASLTAPSAAGDTVCGNSTPAWADCVPGVAPRTVSVGPDTIVAGDRLNLIVSTSSTAVAASIASAASLGNNFTTKVCVQGAGTYTITPTTSTINGGSSYAITEGHCAQVISDNTNYTAYATNGLLSTDSTLTTTPSAFGNQLALAATSLPFGGGVGTSFQDVSETAAPGNPASGNDRLYADSTSHTIKCLTSSGGSCLAAGGGAATALVDTNALNEITTTATGSAVNFFNVTNAATGNPPTFASTGSDTNVGFNFNNKGTGAVAFGWNGSNYLTMSSAGALGIANSTTGQNIAINPASNSSIITTLLGTGSFKVKGSGVVSDNVGVIEFGAAAPTGDALEIQNSSAVAMASIGPSGIVQSAGTQIVSGADYTNSTVTPSTVFSWTLPPTVSAKTYRYSCTGLWESTNTTLVGPVFGVSISAAPTQLTALASVQNTLAGADVNGYLSNTTTGSQTVVTGGAAGATSTNYWFTISGTIEGAPTAGSTFIINAASTSGTTATLNIRRGSSCHLQ